MTPQHYKTPKAALELLEQAILSGFRLSSTPMHKFAQKQTQALACRKTGGS